MTGRQGVRNLRPKRDKMTIERALQQRSQEQVKANLEETAGAPQPTLAEAGRLWLKIGFLSFGGPAAQLSLMHKEIVEARRWLREQDYMGALSLCMLLPGPEAMQMATYLGWRFHGVQGGLMAGLLFVLPGASILIGLAATYSFLGQVQFVEAVFFGIKAAVLVLVLNALRRLAAKTLKYRTHGIIAGAAFIGLFFLSMPYPLLIVLAGAYGWRFASTPTQETPPVRERVSGAQTMLTVALWLALWALPFAVLILSGLDGLLVDVGLFFSKLAIVTFGGAYAVLAYMAQDVVGQYGWLTAGEMVDALGLAETTPGPLILVTEFVGFVAGFKEAGLGLAFLAGLMALWVTFVPCFLWIFAAAPYVNWIASQPRLRGALQGVSAAVVGVILNLSLWFALHVAFSEVRFLGWHGIGLWQPVLYSVQWLAIGLFALNALFAFGFRWGYFRLLVVSSAAGVGLDFWLS